MYGQRNNVTMLNELPDLEDLEGVGESRNQDAKSGPPDYQKYIRNSHTMMSHSGMNRMHMDQEAPPPPHQPPQPPQPLRPFPEVHMTYNCIDIAKHIQECPICSRFYNNDKTLYIIIIIVLSLICLLLLKKVLNV